MSENRIPSGRLHSKLADPGWQECFRLWVRGAFLFQRELFQSWLTPCADHEKAYGCAATCLEGLRTFLIDSAVDAEPYGVYAGPPHVLTAYETACRMFVEGERREIESGREKFPIKTLAYIHALLEGHDPHKAVKEVRELVKDAVREIGLRKADAQTAERPSREILCTQTDVWTFFHGKGRGRGKVLEKLKGQSVEHYHKANGKYWVVLTNSYNDERFREHIRQRRLDSKRGKARKSVEECGRARTK